MKNRLYIYVLAFLFLGCGSGPKLGKVLELEFISLEDLPLDIQKNLFSISEDTLWSWARKIHINKMWTNLETDEIEADKYVFPEELVALEGKYIVWTGYPLNGREQTSLLSSPVIVCRRGEENTVGITLDTLLAGIGRNRIIPTPQYTIVGKLILDPDPYRTAMKLEDIYLIK